MYDPKDITRWRKVKAMAERGEDGERENARRLLTQLEQKHPGIAGFAAKQEAEERLRENMKKAGVDWPEGAPFTPPPPPPDATWREKMVYKAVDWAWDQLRDVFEDAPPSPDIPKPKTPHPGKRPPAPKTEDTIPKAKTPHPGASMAAQVERLVNKLKRKCEVQVDLYADDEEVDMIEVAFKLPVDLWEEVVKRKDARSAFVDFLDEALVEAAEAAGEEEEVEAPATEVQAES